MPPRLLAALTPGQAAFYAVQSVKQFLETIRDVGLYPERRQRAQKAHRRLGAELAPDVRGEFFASVSIVGGFCIVDDYHAITACRQAKPCITVKFELIPKGLQSAPSKLDGRNPVSFAP